MASRLEGTLERITFHDEDDGYTVGRLRPGLPEGATEAGDAPAGDGRRSAAGEAPAAAGRERSALVTIVGYLHAPRVGDHVRLEGEWTDHPDYGRQFKVSSCELVLPRTAEGVERYLASGFIRGVGPATAKALVKRFGVDALRIIQEEPERLTEADGIGPGRARSIAEAYAGQKDLRDVMIFLESVGASPALAARIYRHYGCGAAAALRENPYRLADEVFGIGFKTADRIARQMGLPSTSPHRIRAGLRYALAELAQDGHVFGPREWLEKRVAEALDVDPDLVSAETAALAAEGLVSVDRFEEGQAVYATPLYNAERSVAEKLRRLAAAGEAGPGPTGPPTGEEVSLAAAEAGIDLSSEQRLAVEQALTHGVLIVTGGPGTGKTTIINCLLRLGRSRGLTAILAAPTGRAAKRMTEATGHDARTIHRTLEVVFTPRGGVQFQRGEHNPLEADVVVVDEVSMVDLILMNHLLKAVAPPTRLVLVGDVDQLPAVGPGSVLRDLIDSDRLPVVRLTRIFRQARESLIVVNAHRINQGRMPITNEKDRDFFFIEEPNPEKILENVVSLCATRLPAHLRELGFSVDPLMDIQVITPMRRTLIGVDNLNAELQRALNPPGWGKAEVALRTSVFRTGDKVMQIKNNYAKEVYNGDIGVLRGVDQDAGEVAVAFPGEGGPRLVVYERDELEELVLAYATTVHKSQGSEYLAVVMPVSTQHYPMLQRHLLYTAVTRAKKLVVMVGTKKAAAIAIRNNKVERRFSGLARRLQGG